MEISAIYHSMDKRFCYGLENRKFLFRIKVKKNDMQNITLHMVDKYIPVSFYDTRASVVMEKVTSDRTSDYYEAVVEMDVVCLRYFFGLEDWQGETLYYGNYEFYETKPEHIDDMFDCPQNLREEERFVIPEWAANQVVYQIFPSRFASSGQVSDRVWYQAPIGAKADLKGDLRGITRRLPYIKSLGVDIIYFTPLFQANTSHKYDTVDYFKIDESFGTEEDLRELVEQAHSLEMRVILDAVFNHTSTDFFAFRDIREKGDQSPYLDWYYIKSFPLKSAWGEKPSYKTFSYFSGMPKLNLQNKEVEDYVLSVVRYWMRSCHIDGWRLDVGDEVSHSFWKTFRKAVKAENKDALIVGEVWHFAGDFLEGDEWDTTMNYPFRAAVLDFAARRKITASHFTGSLGFLRGNIHSKVFPVLWNLIDSHDTERAFYTCGENRERFKLAAAIQLLSEGMPMIYYGDEVGMNGGGDPDCRRGMIWKEELQDKEILSWYRQLIRLRKDYPVITEGKVVDIYTDDRRGIVAITRKSVVERTGKDLRDGVTIVFYNGEEPIDWDCHIGEYDLITGQRFSGTLNPCQVLVLKEGEGSTDETI